MLMLPNAPSNPRPVVPPLYCISTLLSIASACAMGVLTTRQRIIPDTNPWLLGLTVVVSLVHMVLDIFAFKNGAL